MVRTAVLLASFACGAFAVLSVATTGDAYGEDKKPGVDAAGAAPPAKRGDAGDRHDPDNVTAISAYMETLVNGTEKYATKDYAGAVELFKKATSLAPRNPLGHYLLGEGYLATTSLAEAEAAFAQAQELSDSKNPALRSHVLFAVADCFERRKKWPEAKTAWQAYADHAAKFTDAGAFPATSTKRLEAITKVLELEKAYVIVRERIAAEKDGGAKFDGGPSASAASDAGAPPKK